MHTPVLLWLMPVLIGMAPAKREGSNIKYETDLRVLLTQDYYNINQFIYQCQLKLICLIKCIIK